MLSSQAIHEARLRLMRIGIVLELRGKRDGVYPEYLDAIRDAFGGTLPVDPFTGEAFRYIPASEASTLYSVGVDLCDDGGVHDPSEGDIVWRGEDE